MEPLLGEMATTEGILYIPLVPFLFDHANFVLIPVWMSFAEAAATTEGATSSNIAEMIEKLTQLESVEAPKISVEEVPASTTTVTEESSQPRDFLEDLSSPTPQLGKI